MPAGSVVAPSIIPLRPPLPGQHKSIISSNIKIELWTETKEAKIYYTINGTRPDPFQKFGDKCTALYRAPFTLPPGKRTVKALAVAGNEGERESPVVTKTFEVEYAPPPERAPFDDDMAFQEDLERVKSKMELERAAADLLKASRTAWADREREDLEEAKLRESTRRAIEEARILESRHSGMYGLEGPMELPRDRLVASDHLVPPYQPEEDPYLPREYTTDAIRALQNMNLHNRHDCFNFSTTTASQQTSTNEWLPTAAYPHPHPHHHIRTPSAHHHPSHYGPEIDIALNRLPPPSPHLSRKVEVKAVGSQTVGPFFPSQQRIEQLEKEVEEKRMMEKQMKERQPLLTAYSPGKGYWRKQLEHIYQHLKAHAQNDAEFRALIGEPIMGKMMGSMVREDGNELSITMTFNLRERKGLFSGKKPGLSAQNGYRGRPMPRQDLYLGSDDDYMSEDNLTMRSTASTRGRRRPTRRPKPKKKVTLKVSNLDSRLLRQLGSEGEGSPSDVQQLIDEGADPECISKSGLPALHLAAKYQHIDCIYVLCGAGVDVNARGPSSRKGNTALHEAVSLGAAGLRAVDALLRCGADQNIKNDRGETPYEMATKAGYDNLAKRFAAALGQTQLQRMIRPHSSLE